MRRGSTSSSAFSPRAPLRRYGFALFCFAVSVTATLVLRRWSGGNEPFYPLFTAGVLVAAWKTGLGPGLLAGALSVLTNGALVVGAGSQLMLPETAEIVRLAAFAVVVTFVSILAETRNRALRAVAVRQAGLQRQAAEMRALLDAVPAAVFVTRDRDARYVEGNAFATQTLGVGEAVNLSKTPDAPARSTTFSFRKNGAEIAPDQLPLQQALARGVAVRDYEIDAQASDGTLRTLLGHAVPFTDERGEARGAIGAFLDITGRKHAEAALERERSLLNTIMQATDVMLVYLDRDFNFVRVNQAYAESCRMRPEEMVGLNHFALYPNEENEAIFRRVRDTGEAVFFKDRPFEYPDQPERGITYWDWSLIPVRSAASSVVGLVFSLRETTPHKRAEEAWRQERERVEQALRDQAAQLADANRVKDEFLATLSHELRTPLNAVLGWAHMLSTGKLPPAGQQQAFGAIQRNADAQRRIIEDLLDVSRIVTGRFTLDPQPTDLMDVLRHAIETIRHAADAKRIDLVVRCDQPGAVTVVADPARLQQVFWNLLVNAVKFSAANGRIEVDVRASDGHVSVRVQDNGAGIPADFLPHVFERFRQRDSTTTRAYGGLGLGLSIVRYVVEMHGGTATAESAGEGRGAAFTVTLPLANAVDSFGVEAPALSSPSRIEGVRVLVVDDEREARELLVTMLDGCGARLTIADSAAAALAHAAADRPDIVISDIAMPGKDGLALLAELRARGFTMPVIALTALGREEERVRALAAGFDVYLSKPVLPEQLFAAIAALAERRTESG